MFDIVETINKNTGEVLTGVPIWFAHQITPYDGRYAMINLAVLQEIALNRTLRPEVKNLLLYMMGGVGFHNRIDLPSRATLAKTLKMHPTQVSVAIRVLIREGFITRPPDVGRAYSFILNAHLLWRGKTSSLPKAQAKVPPLLSKRASQGMWRGAPFHIGNSRRG